MVVALETLSQRPGASRAGEIPSLYLTFYGKANTSSLPRQLSIPFPATAKVSVSLS